MVHRAWVLDKARSKKEDWSVEKDPVGYEILRYIYARTQINQTMPGKEVAAILCRHFPANYDHDELLRLIQTRNVTEHGFPLREANGELPTDPFEFDIQAVQARLDEMHAEIARDLQQILLGLANRHYVTLEERRAVANSVQRILNQISWAAKCPVCEKPARLRVAKAIRYSEGAFQFVHPKTTHQWGDDFPRFSIVPQDNGKVEKHL